MTTPSSSTAVVIGNIVSMAVNTKQQANLWYAKLTGGSVSSDDIFGLAVGIKGFIDNLVALRSTSGIDALAPTIISGYSGTLTADVDTVVNKLRACNDWIVANFPKDSTATYLMSHTINADGTRMARTFTPAQTAGLAIAVAAVRDSIG